MTRKFGSRVLISCVASAVLSTASAQQAAVPPQPGASGAAAPNVAQEGRSRVELRKDLRKAQDRFNALYNKLNPDRDQHVICDDSADTGSRFTKHRCATAGARSASTQDVIDYMAAANQSATLAGQGAASSSPLQVAAAASATGVAPTNAAVVAGHQGAELDSGDETYHNLVKLAAEHPDLRRAMEEYAAAYRRYQAAQAK